MTRLTEEYGIEEDARYPQCDLEALVSLALFVFAAIASIVTAYSLTRGRTVDEYGAVLGMPTYIVLSIGVTFVLFMLAVAVSLRTVFRDIALTEPEATSTLDDVHDGR